MEPPFQSAKENLIAELKMSRDISGIKKLKVERVEMEKKQGKEIASTISKQFTVDSFVEKVSFYCVHLQIYRKYQNTVFALLLNNALNLIYSTRAKKHTLVVILDRISNPRI